jgi:hypothetical protein
MDLCGHPRRQSLRFATLPEHWSERSLVRRSAPGYDDALTTIPSTCQGRRQRPPRPRRSKTAQIHSSTASLAVVRHCASRRVKRALRDIRQDAGQRGQLLREVAAAELAGRRRPGCGPYQHAPRADPASALLNWEPVPASTRLPSRRSPRPNRHRPRQGKYRGRAPDSGHRVYCHSRS